MEISEIVSYVVTALGAGGVTQFANWRISRRKASAEVKSDEIDNMRKAMQDFYEPLVERQNKRIGELEEEVRNLRQERQAMQDDYQRQLAAMQQQISELYRALGMKAKAAAKTRKKEGA